MKINIEFWVSELQTILKALDYLEYRDVMVINDNSLWSDLDYTRNEISDVRMVAGRIREEIKEVIYNVEDNNLPFN